MRFSFKGGLHTDSFKRLSRESAIADTPLPARVTIPMLQHVGAPCVPLVRKGDRVLTGQRIGEPQGFVSAPVHSSITGTVTDVGLRPHPYAGRDVVAVDIERDVEDGLAPGANQTSDPTGLSPDQLRAMIHDAGVVGMGGAMFPTHVKLSPPPNVKIDTLILNGVECEPYLTCDDRLMREKASEIVSGLCILLRIVNIPRAIIAIEEDKPEAFAAMEKAVKSLASQSPSAMRLVSLKMKFPQGSEHHLIKAVLGREIPWRGGLPMAIGALVSNVGTARAVHDAVCRGTPLTSRVVTVTGDGVDKPGNFMVRIGTAVSDLLAVAGLRDDATRLVLGGPMTGFAQSSSGVPVLKGTGGIVVLRDPQAVRSGPCIRCARCVNACSYRIMPAVLSRAIEANDIDAAASANLMECKECGCCVYVCPAKRPILHQIRQAKMEAAKRKAAAQTRTG
jgi:Na+-translocating ferredoxin:NAD+ oxidoreductase subunit C